MFKFTIDGTELEVTDYKTTKANNIVKDYYWWLSSSALSSYFAVVNPVNKTSLSSCSLGRSFPDSDTYAIRPAIVIKGKECKHTFASTEYTWSSDNSKMTAIGICTKCSTKETEEVNTVSKVTQEADCTKSELTTYIATFKKYDFSEQTKNVETKAALGHTLEHHDEAAATETTTGTKEYWQCSVCKKYFSDADGKNEIAAVEMISVVKPASPAKDNIAEIGNVTLTVSADIDSTAPTTSVVTKASDIVTILKQDGTLTADEIKDIDAGNSNVEVILGVTNNKDSISATSKDLIKEKADAEGMTIAEYMDITLTKYIIPTGKTLAEASATQNITELKSEASRSQ